MAEITGYYDLDLVECQERRGGITTPNHQMGRHKKGQWIPPEVELIEDKAEKLLVGHYKLAHMHGKGKKYVPVLTGPGRFVLLPDVL